MSDVVFITPTMKMLEERQPKIVSFYCRCDTYHIVRRLAEYIKARMPGVYVVCGGPQADIVAEETIRQIHWIDYVCCGEGEETVYPFFSSLLQKTPDLSIPGLVYRKGDQVVKNPRPALIEDLDSIPSPDYTLLQYTDPDELKNQAFTVDIGRGENIFRYRNRLSEDAGNHQKTTEVRPRNGSPVPYKIQGYSGDGILYLRLS